ncbi:hypothetical protein SAMN05414137_114104 [Streptacidiphilus jiangxiensis]|uniref:Uncharacterized protein n=2 Tax=Streptacidiphilus jiangxiensis TaxID=235985 RepID=A0A1H7TN00_STRJI|nr:hypothetical protein SAMN05414137_114104 [Streptacidiphilus jiangxiensis]
MTLSADHMFTAIGLERTVPDGDCNSTLMRGTWEFFVPMPGDSSGHSHVTDASATQGQSFGVIFGSGQSPVCSGLTGEIQRDAAGLDICLVEDGDEACADDEILRHQ